MFFSMMKILKCSVYNKYVIKAKARQKQRGKYLCINRSCTTLKHPLLTQFLIDVQVHQLKWKIIWCYFWLCRYYHGLNTMIIPLRQKQICKYYFINTSCIIYTPMSITHSILDGFTSLVAQIKGNSIIFYWWY